MSKPIHFLIFTAWSCLETLQASPVSIQNAGFEADFAAPNTFPVLIPQGWSVFDPQGIYNGNNHAVGVLNPTGSTYFPGGAPEGRNVALTWLDDGPGSAPLGLRQTLGATLAAHTRYTLTVEVGNIDSGIGSPPFDRFGFFNIKGFPGYVVQLLAGGQLLAEDRNSLANTLGEGQFATSTLLFFSTAQVQPEQNLEIRLINLNRPGSLTEPGIEVDFDHVRLDATIVPIPGSLGFLSSAFLALLGMGWRKVSSGVNQDQTHDPAL